MILIELLIDGVIVILILVKIPIRLAWFIVKSLFKGVGWTIRGVWWIISPTKRKRIKFTNPPLTS